MFKTAHVFIPTSANGRLYLYFPLQSIDLQNYLALSVVERLFYIPDVFRENFIRHPVVLLTCILPGAITVVLPFFAWKLSISSHKFRVLLTLSVYTAGNIAVYVLYQPLIFQRYLISALPAAILSIAIVTTACFQKIEITPRLMPVHAYITLAVIAIASNAVGTRYFDIPTVRGAQTIELFKELDARTSGQECRIAAEPLGIAAYFTHCYVIDLGGLINPDIWPYWLTAGATGNWAATRRYAIEKGAQFLYSSDILDRETAKNFEKWIATGGTQAIYRYVDR
jgi:hypothetical protein